MRLRHIPFPTIRLAVIATVLALVALVAGFYPNFRESLFILDAVIVFVVLLDLLWSQRFVKSLDVKLQTSRLWSSSREEQVQVSIENKRVARIRGALVPDFPLEGDGDRQLCNVNIRKGEALDYSWSFTIQQRGRYLIDGIFVRILSPLSLWQWRSRQGAVVQIRVYPDIKAIDDFAILSRTNRLGLIGIRQDRQSGASLEFERLRPFTTGDSMSRIDWKATARANEPMVRDFRAERNQNVILMLDIGRMMNGMAGERSQLDRALDALLLLAHVAISQGDRVGLIVYSDEIVRLLPFGGGGDHYGHIIHALHDVQAQDCESRHDLAYLQLARRFSQRSLVVHISSFLDELNAQLIQRHLQFLVGKHLPLGVFLRNEELFSFLEDPEQQSVFTQENQGVDKDDIYSKAVAAEIALARKKSLKTLEASGVLLIDCKPEELSGHLINRYMGIKARNLL